MYLRLDVEPSENKVDVMRGESPDQVTPTIRRTEGDRRCNNIEGLGFQRACKGSNSSRFNGVYLRFIGVY